MTNLEVAIYTRSIINRTITGIISRGKWSSCPLFLFSSLRARCRRAKIWLRISLCAISAGRSLILLIRLINMCSRRGIILMLLLRWRRKLLKNLLFLRRISIVVFSVCTSLHPSWRIKLICRVNIVSSFLRESTAKIWKGLLNIFKKKYRWEMCVSLAKTRKQRISNQLRQWGCTWSAKGIPLWIQTKGMRNTKNYMTFQFFLRKSWKNKKT